MSVTVDDHPLAAETLGLKTVGQVLSHLKKDRNRLIVHVLIDGREPDLDRMGAVKRSPLNGHTVYIETAEPRRMALEVLADVEEQLNQTDRLKTEAADLLQQNQTAAASRWSNFALSWGCPNATSCSWARAAGARTWAYSPGPGGRRRPTWAGGSVWCWPDPAATACRARSTSATSPRSGCPPC